jgi:hypothetical protein
MPPRLARKNPPIHRFVQDGALHHRKEFPASIMKRFLCPPLAISILTACPAVTEAGSLKVHGIFASNIAFPTGKTQQADIGIAQSNLMLLRFFSMDPNVRFPPQHDIQAEIILERIKVPGQTMKQGVIR